MEKYIFNEEHAKIYIPQDGKDYAIVDACRDGACTVSTEIPINFKARENGEYTLTVSESLNSKFLILNYLHLIDNLTGADIDLLATPSYTFEGHISDYASRFKLVFNAVDDGSEKDDFAFISNGEIIINGDGLVQVFDLLGHQLHSHESNSEFRIPNSAFPAGVYVLRLINGDNVKTQKIIIK